MIPGQQTNTIYLSEWLKKEISTKENAQSLVALLNKNGIEPMWLSKTKDIWCRDYMPIQVAKDRFVQFRYEPSYLKNKLRYQSDPKSVCKANNLHPRFSKINLDGGNVVNWSDRAIISDRVLDENPDYSSKTKLISDIEELLEVEIIVIPQIKSDRTGHADGMVRFVDRNTVIGNDRNWEYKYWKKRIDKVMQQKGITYIDFPSFESSKDYPDNAFGCYINYLEIQDLIIMPIFELKENMDETAHDKLSEVFRNRKIETINVNSIGCLGGLLNCCTWTILK